MQNKKSSILVDVFEAAVILKKGERQTRRILDAEGLRPALDKIFSNNSFSAGKVRRKVRWVRAEVVELAARLPTIKKVPKRPVHSIDSRIRRGVI